MGCDVRVNIWSMTPPYGQSCPYMVIRIAIPPDPSWIGNHTFHLELRLLLILIQFVRPRLEDEWWCPNDFMSHHVCMYVQYDVGFWSICSTRFKTSRTFTWWQIWLQGAISDSIRTSGRSSLRKKRSSSLLVYWLDWSICITRGSYIGISSLRTSYVTIMAM